MIWKLEIKLVAALFYKRSTCNLRLVSMLKNRLMKSVFLRILTEMYFWSTMIAVVFIVV